MKVSRKPANGISKKMRMRKLFSCLYIESVDKCISSMANGVFKDAADLHAQIGDFSQAIVLYEQIANYSLQSTLTKYSVKEYWLRSGLCALANRVTYFGLIV